MYELNCIYDARQSFYGKAQVSIDPDGYRLYSYGSMVAFIDRDGEVYINFGIYQWNSNTSLRHIKEFVKQETGVGYDINGLRELKDYSTYKRVIKNDKEMLENLSVVLINKMKDDGFDLKKRMKLIDEMKKGDISEYPRK